MAMPQHVGLVDQGVTTPLSPAMPWGLARTRRLPRGSARCSMIQRSIFCIVSRHECVSCIRSRKLMKASCGAEQQDSDFCMPRNASCGTDISALKICADDGVPWGQQQSYWARHQCVGFKELMEVSCSADTLEIVQWVSLGAL